MRDIRFTQYVPSCMDFAIYYTITVFCEGRYQILWVYEICIERDHRPRSTLFPFVHIHINRAKGSNCLLDTM